MKIAVITGASSGMGREFALQLPKWEKFDEIWVIARRRERLESLEAEIGVRTRVFALDLTREDSFDEYAAALAECKPEVSVLVNCSGYGKFGKYDEIPLDDSIGMIRLNSEAVVRMTTLTLPYMKKGSKIANLDSLSSFQPVPYMAVYGATKAFVLSYTRALGRELVPRGIKTIAICPGWVATEFFDRATTTNDKAVVYYNRVYKADEVVKTALHDMYRTKKDVSIHGFPVKVQVFLVKLLPHKLVMRVWLKQQKHI